MSRSAAMARREFQPIRFGHSHGDSELIQRCYRQIANSSSRLEVLTRMSADHWLKALRPVLFRDKFRESDLGPWTHEKLEAPSESHVKVKAATLRHNGSGECVTCKSPVRIEERQNKPKDPRKVTVKSPRYTKVNHSNPPERFGVTSKGLVNRAPKSVPLDESGNGIVEVSNERHNFYKAVQWPDHLSRSLKQITLDTNQSKGGNVSSFDSTRFRLEHKFKFMDIGRNANRVYEDGHLPKASKFPIHSSVDPPVVSNVALTSIEDDFDSIDMSKYNESNAQGEIKTEPCYTLNKAGKSGVRLAEDEHELPSVVWRYLKPSEDLTLGSSNLASQGEPNLEKKKVDLKSSSQAPEKLVSDTKMLLSSSELGLKASESSQIQPLPSLPGLRKASSDLFTLETSSGHELPKKQKSDVAVGEERVETVSGAIQVDLKDEKQSARKAPSSHSPATPDEPSRSASIEEPKRNRSTGPPRQPDPRPGIKPGVLNHTVPVVDYTRKSALDRTLALEMAEEQRSKMRNSLLGVYEYDINGHRQSKIVFSHRQTKKIPGKPTAIEKPTSRRRTRKRITQRTVAASPSVIAGLWKQVVRERLRRRRKHQLKVGFWRRSLPLAPRQDIADGNIYCNATSLNHREQPQVKTNEDVNEKNSCVNSNPWLLETLAGSGEVEDGLSFTEKFKLDASIASGQPCCPSPSACSRHDELINADQSISSESRERQNMENHKTSTIYLSVLARGQIPHFSPPSARKKRTKAKPSKQKKKVVRNQANRSEKQTVGLRASQNELHTQFGSILDKSMNKMAARRAKKPIKQVSSAPFVGHKRVSSTAVLAKAASHTKGLKTSKSSPKGLKRTNPLQGRITGTRSQEKGVKSGRPAALPKKDIGSHLEGRPSPTKISVGSGKDRSSTRPKKGVSRPSPKLGKSRSERASNSQTPGKITSWDRGKPGSTGHLSVVQKASLDNQLPSASDPNLNKLASETELLPSLAVRLSREGSCASHSSATDSSCALETPFPCELIEASKHRGSPLKRFGSSLVARLQHHQAERNPLKSTLSIRFSSAEVDGDLSDMKSLL